MNILTSHRISIEFISKDYGQKNIPYLVDLFRSTIRRNFARKKPRKENGISIRSQLHHGTITLLRTALNF